MARKFKTCQQNAPDLLRILLNTFPTNRIPPVKPNYPDLNGPIHLRTTAPTRNLYYSAPQQLANHYSDHYSTNHQSASLLNSIPIMSQQSNHPRFQSNRHAAQIPAQLNYTRIVGGVSVVICIWFWLFKYDRNGALSRQQIDLDDGDSTNNLGITRGNDNYLDLIQQANQYEHLKTIELKFYNLLPLRVTSSLWGKINSYDLPIWMRSRLYDFFCRTYNCDMSEALESDYRNYRNLSEFFSRRLKPDSRPISQEPGVVSPADGLILHFGPIMDGRIEGVKGLNYSIQAFLGLKHKQQQNNSNPDLINNPDLNQDNNNPNSYLNELLHDKENNELYNCIIYLAPGDYHRFHSPADWTVKHRKHFPGRLLSVRPSLMKRMPEVLHINERVCYIGDWPHGFFSMTAVGATNVGSIKVNFDEVSEKHLQYYLFSDVR